MAWLTRAVLSMYPEGTRRHVVGDHHLGIKFLVVGLAQDRKGVGSHRQHELLGGRAHPCVRVLAHLHGAGQSVFLHSEPDVSVGHHAVLMDGKMLLLGVAEHHGTAGRFRHDGRKYQGLHVAAVELGAEAASHGRSGQTHLLVRHVQGRRHVLVAVSGSRG